VATLSVPLTGRSRVRVLPVSWLLRLPYPLRNAVRRWRGLLAMILGVGFALSIGMTILAVISAEMDALTGDYKRSGLEVFVATQGGTLVARLAGDTPGTIQHGRAVLAQTRAWPEVQTAVGALTTTMTRETDGPRRRGQPAELVSVVGLEGDPLGVPGLLAMEEGRWLRGTREVVLGRKLAQDKGLHVGDSLRLNGVSFTVAGIGKLRGFAAFGQSSVAYMDYRAILQRSAVGDVFNVIAVQTRDPASVVRRLNDLGGLTSWTPDQLVAEAEQASASGLAIDWVLIILTLAIAGLFVNTMLNHSVSERRGQFAVLRAIGLPAYWIVLTVALEAVTITVVAGVVAVGISLGLGALLNATIAQQYGFDSLYRADASLFSLIFGLAAALGVASGVVPARKAAGVDPVEVLREA
jgi:ABC-type antimicrobial peptide transport system permease subunit